jgi:four helix bundle protein
MACPVLSAGMGKERDLKKRTMNFAVAVSDLCERLPNTIKGRHVSGQLFRAGTAVAANYRAACRGKSKPDFIAKLGTVIEEADECDFWLEFAVAAKLLTPQTERALRTESGELVAIFTQSQITARASLAKATTAILIAIAAAYYFIL